MHGRNKRKVDKEKPNKNKSKIITRKKIELSWVKTLNKSPTK